MAILEHGQWDGNIDGEHVFDSGLADEILKLLKSHGYLSIVDMGCGPGEYTKRFIKAGYEATGVDGNPNTPMMTQGLCGVCDLSQPVNLGKYDVCMCLEVGEHIPKQYEQTLLDNIKDAATYMVILSWAVPGQGGYGHVNCQTNQYITTEMSKRGFVRHIELESEPRANCHASWFKDTFMVFKRA